MSVPRPVPFEAPRDAADVLPVDPAGRARGLFARPVWRNDLGGTTFVLTADPDGPPEAYLKWAPRSVADALGLGDEADRLTWAGRWARVPRVLARGGTSAGDWLLTAALSGTSAVAPPWVRDPETAVRAVGVGLRLLHDALPVEDCPWEWSRRRRHDRVLAAWATGSHPRADLPVGPDRIPLSEALARLADVPDDDVLVVCHGDACAPNTLLDDDGAFAGHVDLGRLGVADRWADLAVATWSTQWNYGPGWERPLLDAYGIEPDPVRSAYYRLLWDAAPD